MSGAPNGGVQQPVFAPVSKVGDDLDLGDIFSDYFISEANDPLNGFGGTGVPPPASVVGSTNMLTIAQPNQEQHQQTNQQFTMPNTQPKMTSATGIGSVQAAHVSMGGAIPLPTGHGIKTAWHAGSLPHLAGSAVVLKQDDPQSQQPAAEPIAKKIKADEAITTVLAVSPVTGMPLAGSHPGKEMLQGIQIQTPTPTAPLGGLTEESTSSSAISGRLGFAMAGGQLTLPQSAPQQQDHSLQQPHPSQMAVLESGAARVGNNIALPVGVGIRVGVPGGVVPRGPESGTVAMARVQGGAAPPIQLSQLQTNSANQLIMWGGVGAPGLSSAGNISEQAIAERRQRNREHAKRSRVRKKFMLESLQEQVKGLQRVNEGLRLVIKERIPHRAQQIISECCAKSPLFTDPTDGIDEAESQSEVELMRSDFSLIESLTSGQQNFVLSDPRLPDNPIVFASEGFYELTGYTREQVLGRNCRFLQGPGTEPRAVDVIRAAIANGADATVCILNYKADGTPFWNQFFVAALRDADNCIVNYVGVQCEVEPEAGASALEDKVNAAMPLQNKDKDETEENS